MFGPCNKLTAPGEYWNHISHSARQFEWVVIMCISFVLVLIARVLSLRAANIVKWRRKGRTKARNNN